MRGRGSAGHGGHWLGDSAGPSGHRRTATRGHPHPPCPRALAAAGGNPARRDVTVPMATGGLREKPKEEKGKRAEESAGSGAEVGTQRLPPPRRDGPRRARPGGAHPCADSGGGTSPAPAAGTLQTDPQEKGSGPGTPPSLAASSLWGWGQPPPPVPAQGQSPPNRGQPTAPPPPGPPGKGFLHVSIFLLNQGWVPNHHKILGNCHRWAAKQSWGQLLAGQTDTAERNQ